MEIKLWCLFNILYIENLEMTKNTEFEIVNISHKLFESKFSQI